MMDIDSIVEKLNNGDVIAMKTDTVYGLICNAKNENSVEKIYSIKKREKKKPLSLFVKDIESLHSIISESDFTSYAISLMKKYWPGALTIIFNKRDDTYNHLLNGKNGIGIRIPRCKSILDILERVDYPLAETSCNISGEKPYISYGEIKEKLGDSVDYIVDDGYVINNTPSTVVSLESGEPILLRDGEVKID